MDVRLFKDEIMQMSKEELFEIIYQYNKSQNKIGSICVSESKEEISESYALAMIRKAVYLNNFCQVVYI